MKTNINKNAFYVACCFIFLSRGSLLKDSAVYKTDLCCVGITQNQGARAAIKLLNLMLWIQVI